MLLQPLVFLVQPPKAAPVVPPAPASRGRLCCRGGLTAPILLPPLARPSLHSPTPPCYSAATAASHRSRTSEPSYSSPHGLPLPSLPRLHVVPFLDLAVHRRGALRAAWSTWSRNDNIGRGTYMERLTVGTHMFHVAARKQVPPYYAKKNEYSH